jgi:mannose-6-phosphate isomerase-like protein (cupin superfamily)
MGDELPHGHGRPAARSRRSPPRLLAIRSICAILRAMRIEHWNEQRDGALTESALRRKLMDLGYRVYFLPHTHDVDKIDAVLSGRFRLTLDGEPVVLGAGDWVAVPRGVVHSAEVVGDVAVVSLDAVRPA